MIRFIFCLAATLSFLSARSQFTVKGKVLNAQKKPVADAVINVLSSDEKLEATGISSSDGSFSLRLKAPGTHRIFINAQQYQRYDSSFELNNALEGLELLLKPLTVVTDEVVVSAIRAKENSATTFTELNKNQIRERNYGQDFPYLLQMTPSTVLNSDAGAGVGYTDIRIRGVDITRINVTINGIPYNDAEGQGAFWVDIPDIASSTQKIQVQRGIGSSTNGAAAFGASININSTGVTEKAYAEASNSYGSFNTHKHTIQMGTGLLNNHWAFETRLSSINSDGYIDRAFSDLKSYYFSAGRYDAKSMFRFVTFTGREKTYQAWNGVPEDKLKNDRTYNSYTYKNEIDHYTQNHYQLFYNYSLSKRWALNSALHFTHGEGYYEQFKENEKLSSYNLSDVIIGGDTIRRTDLIRRRWLNNDYYGIILSAIYDDSKKTTVTLGGAASNYDGNHYGELIWAKYASNSFNDYRYYDNDAQKTDMNVYVKLEQKLNRHFTGYLDLQERFINYEFLGINQNLEPTTYSVDYAFFNPKAGLVYTINAEKRNSDIYLSYSRASREPVREDFIASSASSRPKPEQMQDFELGFRHLAKRFSLTVNAYLMLYKDQLVLTGQINDVGAATRTNVPESYRSGIEMAGSVNILRKLQWSGNLTLSMNKASDFTEFMYDWNSFEESKFTYAAPDLALSPNVIGASTFRWLPFNGFTADLQSKYVGKQYLDNTQSDKRKIDAYLLNDVVIAYQKALPKNFSFIRAGLQLNNVLDEKYESKGYTYGEIVSGQRIDYNFYYPQAGFNWMLQLTLGF